MWLHLGDGSEQKKIKSRAKGLLGKNAVFPGNVPNEKIGRIYRKYNVSFFVNMSDSEGIPVSIMEAMSMGIPAVARNVGGVSEIVKDGMNGFLLDEKRTDMKYLGHTAKKIVGAWKKENEYLRLCNNAESEWEMNYCIDRNMEIFLNDFIGD